MKMNHESQQKYDLCKKHMHAYVLAETTDGNKLDGIITGLDDENVYFAIPNDQHNPENMQANQHHSFRDERQSRYGYGYGYGPGFGYPGYGHGYGRPRRRFNRLVLPLAALTALSILPWY